MGLAFFEDGMTTQWGKKLNNYCCGNYWVSISKNKIKLYPFYTHHKKSSKCVEELNGKRQNFKKIYKMT